jgi:ligand-binding SRPBCC domain-containing protein
VPVVSVLALRPDDGGAIHRTLAAIVTSVSEALATPPESVWAHFVSVDAVQQGEQALDFRGHCPVVIVRGAPRDPVIVAAALTLVATAVASALDVPMEDVWVQWVDAEPGYVFAGGEVMK